MCLCSSGRRFLSTLALLLGSWLLNVNPKTAAGQLPESKEPQHFPQVLVEFNLPEQPAPAWPAVVEPSPKSSPPHVFWDRTNLTLFSGVILSRAADYASTRNMQARGREEVLLPDDVVNNSAGFAALESAGTAASVGLSYWMHRAGHHKMERWISIVHIGVTGFGIARNYSLPTNRAGR
jgi:hypothetical protein